MQEKEGRLDMGEFEQLRREVNSLLEQNEVHLRQRAKTDWLKQGDRNSKFFHACINQRRRANGIHSIADELGRVFSNPKGVENAFLSYFQGLFSSSNPSNIEGSLDHLDSCITLDMNRELTMMVTKEEVYGALMQMAPLKSSGLDGFLASFYQNNWEEVGDEVCTAVLNFFENGCLDGTINHTNIALIPKLPNPSCVTEFRPMSLCNVLVKIVSKVMANRLKIILPSIISSNQSAFIPWRLSSDNILVVYETLHFMHYRMWGKEGYMAIKLDMSKAYDRVE
jgi:hypothetical protein